MVTTATTNLFGHPIFKDGAFTANDRDVRRFALAKVMRNLDLAAELGAKTYVFWGGREGAESGAAKDIRAALDRYAEGLDLLGEYVIEQGYDIRFAIEPKPNEPRGDILLPTLGHALAFINQLEHSEHGRRQPRDRARGDGRAELRRRHRPGAVARQALPHRPQRPARAAVRPGPAVRRGQRARRVLGRGRVVQATAAYDGPVHFDFKPPRTEDDEGVWASAAACMRNYLILRDKVRGVPGRPGGAGGAGRVEGGRARPARPWPQGETWRDVREVSIDIDALRRPRAWATSTWTSWPWSTSTGSADQ